MKYLKERHREYTLSEVEIVDDNNVIKKGFVFRDRHGEILDRKTALEYIDLLQTSYSESDIDGFIEENNKLAYLHLTIELTMYSSMLKFQKINEKMYQINRPEYKKKLFNKGKRNWSFHCSLCNKKVSSNVDESYFLVTSSFDQYFDMESERTCSVACADVVFKEYLKRWIKEKELDDFVFINF